MNKLLILVFFFVFSFNSYSQNKELTDSTLVCGVLKDFTSVGKYIELSCYLSDTQYLNEGTFLVVSGVKKCESKKFFKVYYKNEEYYIELSKLLFHDDTDYFEIINNFSAESKERFNYHAKAGAALYHYNKLKKLVDFMDSCKPKGVAVLKWSVYDESEYTDGTGVKIVFHNPTKKTIKYIWVGFIGYNAVQDKVIDRGKSLKSVKCIGPIAPESDGSYEFEYVWFTDIVENAKISSLKVQYMDGTMKNVISPSKVILDSDIYEYCLDEN